MVFRNVNSSPCRLSVVYVSITECFLGGMSRGMSERSRRLQTWHRRIVPSLFMGGLSLVLLRTLCRMEDSGGGGGGGSRSVSQADILTDRRTVTGRHTYGHRPPCPVSADSWRHRHTRSRRRWFSVLMATGQVRSGQVRSDG